MLWLWCSVGGALLLFVIIYILIYIFIKTRRISSVEDLPRNCAGKKLSGIVTFVPDGDGFKLFHTPWFGRTRYSSEDNKINIRLAGIDAPEMGSIQTPGQPFARKSKEYLTNLILHKKVNIKILGVDQYNRALAIAYLPSGCVCLPDSIFGTNVNLHMVENGYACVYTGRDAKYDGLGSKLRKLEENAKRKKKGLWKLSNVETPMEYKRKKRERKK